MNTSEMIELSAALRKRRDNAFIAAHRREFADALEQETAPLKARIAELEGLLADAERADKAEAKSSARKGK